MCSSPFQARQEVDSVLEDAGREEATFEDLKRMTFLNGFMMENLRLFPPAVSFNRETVHEEEILGKTVPPGVRVFPTDA